jgi:hypothetical protein
LHRSSSAQFHKNFLLEACCCPLRSLTSKAPQSAWTQRCCLNLGNAPAPRSSCPQCEAKVFQQPFRKSTRTDDARARAACFSDFTACLPKCQGNVTHLRPSRRTHLQSIALLLLLLSLAGVFVLFLFTPPLATTIRLNLCLRSETTFELQSPVASL